MLPLEGLGMDASGRLTPESLANPPEEWRAWRALEQDFDRRRFRTPAPEKLGREVQVDALGLRQLASRVPVVACALELLFTPQEHAFGFGVEIEVLKFRRSHSALEFGRDPASVLPRQGDLMSSS